MLHRPKHGCNSVVVNVCTIVFLLTLTLAGPLSSLAAVLFWAGRHREIEAAAVDPGPHAGQRPRARTPDLAPSAQAVAAAVGGAHEAAAQNRGIGQRPAKVGTLGGHRDDARPGPDDEGVPA